MKVVQVNCYASGSTGNIAKAIHSELLFRGHQSYIFYGGGLANQKYMYRIGNYFSLHIHSFLSRNLGLQGYFSYFSTLKLIKDLKKIKPEIIHLHNLHGSYLNLPLFFKFLKKTTAKIFITLHDCWLFTGKCPHFTIANCYKWKEKCGKCPQLSIYPKSKIDTTKKCLQDKKKWLSDFGDRMKIIAVSNWLANTAKESFLSQYPIKTIYNGIDYDVFYPRHVTNIRTKYKLDDKFVILGVSSNWNNQKGLNEFLELSSKLSENEIIVLVGLTKQQISTMPQNIIGIIRTENQNELAELYSTADVFVNLSKEETFGLVTAEAISCGTPVIVYDSTACAEIVNESNGIVLSPNTPINYDIIKKIKRELEGFKVKGSFNKEIMVRRYLNEYNAF